MNGDSEQSKQYTARQEKSRRAAQQYGVFSRSLFNIPAGFQIDISSRLPYHYDKTKIEQKDRL
jgi:hypothetical protein